MALWDRVFLRLVPEGIFVVAAARHDGDRRPRTDQVRDRRTITQRQGK